MPEGGKIVGSTMIVNNSVVFKIQDTGKGISEHDQGRLFEPFWTTKGSAGTGLGLSVSKKIVVDHGGTISVESQVGQGSTFTVEIPLAKEARAEPQTESSAIPAMNLRILVIDDSEPIVMLLRDLLTSCGQTVFSACSGNEGLEVFGRNELDMVVCDLGMPDKSGWEVGRRIVSICQERGISKPHFVLLTGWGGQSLEGERLRQSGVNEVLAKPVDSEKLVELLNRVAANKSSVNL